MYVDNEDGQTISVIDVATNSVDETITLGFMPGIASYNGPKNELWVSDPMNGKVHYLDLGCGMNMWMHGSSFKQSLVLLTQLLSQQTVILPM